MDTSKFDGQIDTLKTQIEPIRGEMEGVCGEFLEATKKLSVEWSQDKVERAITSKHELTKKYGTEGLRKLKSDLGKLVADIPQIVDNHVNKDEYWAHRGELPDDSDYGRYLGSPDWLKDAIREVLGYVGSLLVEHDFVDTGEHSEWEATHGTSALTT